MLWNGQDAPPEGMDANGDNYLKSFTSRTGVKITFDDSPGAESLKLETPAGQTVTLSDEESGITAADSNGNSVKIDSSGITVQSSANVTVNASQVEVSASMLTVNSGISKFSGVVQEDTVLTNSIVAATYSPGTGNIW